MAFQSQTFSNSNSCYYVSGGGQPIVPGDQTIQGPIEIAATASGSSSAYYNRFSQDDTNGLTIDENQLPTTLNSRIRMGGPFPSVQISAVAPGITTSLTVGQASGIGGPGEVTVNGNNGLVVSNSAGSGTSLRIYHDTPTNKNIITNAGGAGPFISFNPNTVDLTFENNILGSLDKIRINNSTSILTIDKLSTGETDALSGGGLTMINTLGTGRVGLFNGTGMDLASNGPVTVRTNLSTTPLTNMTANTNGTVSFLSTIAAPTVSTTTLRANMVSSINANIGTIDSIQINNTGTVFTGTLGATVGNITTVNTGSIDAATSLNIRTNVSTAPYNTITANANGTVSFLSTISGPRAAITTGSFNTVNTTTMNTTNGSISTLNAGAITTSTLTVTTSASIPALTSVSSINALSITNYVGPPIGSMFPWAGVSGTVPSGYLFCDGTYYSLIGQYAALGAVIGQSWGPVITDMFAVPDMRTKTAFGASQFSGVGNYTFQVTGASFSQLPATTTPPSNPAGGNYAPRQCLSITNIPTGFMLFEGDQIGVGSNNSIITGIINSDSSPGGGKNIVVILAVALPADYGAGTVFDVFSGVNGCRNTQTRYGNYTNQLGREVGIHTHGTVATGSNNNASAASGRSEPTFSQPINQPNGQFTINSVTFTLPYSANNIPSAVFSSWIIKF